MFKTYEKLLREMYKRELIYMLNITSCFAIRKAQKPYNGGMVFFYGECVRQIKNELGSRE